MADLNKSLETRFDPRPMSVKDWFFTIFILAIPVVGIVMDFVWAFGSSGNLNRRNFCRASLIWAAIGLAIILVLLLLAGGSGYS